MRVAVPGGTEPGEAVNWKSARVDSAHSKDLSLIDMDLIDMDGDSRCHTTNYLMKERCVQLPVCSHKSWGREGKDKSSHTL